MPDTAAPSDKIADGNIGCAILRPAARSLARRSRGWEQVPPAHSPEPHFAVAEI